MLVATMYVDSCKTGKYIRHLLRQSFRDNGKVKHRTLANLSHCSEQEIQAIKLALKHKDNLSALGKVSKKAITLEQGLSVGAVLALQAIAKELGLDKALGHTHEGKLALWQVIARLIDQGSRLSAVRLAGSHAACDALGLEQSFNENDLYENLDWLCQNQSKIEQKLFQSLYPEQPPALYLYDVTSSYLEGDHNALAAWGYNRDGKKGKKQIVIGLLCDEAGRALSVEAFKGNTQDPRTVAAQIQKVAQRFGGEAVTFVGDRGMIKNKQIEDLTEEGFHYITAITKPQIKTLLNRQVLQMELFEETIAQVQDDQIRYILRKNPIRAEEIASNRRSKLEKVNALIEQKNDYLQEHPRASGCVALREVNALAKKLKIHSWIEVSEQERSIALQMNQEALAQEAQLDGCYALKTDLKETQASKHCIHERYKDLAYVEKAFRCCKTVELEMRPIHVRLESRTRGHAFVVMLAYRIAQHLANCWQHFNITVQEGIDQLSSLCATDLTIDAYTRCSLIPKPRPQVQKLLKAANIKLPESISCKNIAVHTKKNLQSSRKNVN